MKASKTREVHEGLLAQERGEIRIGDLATQLGMSISGIHAARHTWRERGKTAESLIRRKGFTGKNIHKATHEQIIAIDAIIEEECLGASIIERTEKLHQRVIQRCKEEGLPPFPLHRLEGARRRIAPIGRGGRWHNRWSNTKAKSTQSNKQV